MSIMELEAKRMGIFRMLLGVESENLLQEIENLLNKEQRSGIDISREAMRNAILRSQDDIQNGRIYSTEQMRAKHPRI